MGLPLLKDLLPEETVPRPRVRPLDRLEEIVRNGERRAADLAKLLEEFVSATRAFVPELSEEDAVNAFEQVAAQEARHRPSLLAGLREWRRLRERVEAWLETPLKIRTLQLFDRQIRCLQSALNTFEWGKDQIESLRDAQELSSRTFWTDDDGHGAQGWSP
jgi:hypothetical protein